MSGLRWISWVAVSSGPQYKKVSPEQQRDANRQLIEALGGHLVDELEVPGHTREYISFEEAASEMDAYRELRELMQRRGADVLVCNDLSRLGRTAALIQQVIAYCHRAGIAIYSRASPPATLIAAEQAKSIGANMMMGLEAMLAEAEMGKMRDRHRVGMRGRVQRGDLPAGVPFGWVAGYDEDGRRTLQIDPAGAEQIRLILRLYLESGLGMWSIADELNRLGYVTPTGRTYTMELVRQHIDRVWRYAGYVEYHRRNKEIETLRVLGKLPAIIDTATAEAVETEQRRRARERRRTGTTYLCSGTLVCGVCGGKLSIAKSAQTRRAGPAYICPNRCKGSFIGEEKIAPMLTEVFADLRSRPGVANAGEDEESKSAQAQIGAALAVAQADLDAIGEQRKRLARSYMAGRLEEAEHDELLGELRARKEGVNVRIESLLDDLQRIQDHEGIAARRRQAAEEGDAILAGDVRVANVWLRQVLRMVVADSEVTQVYFLP